MWKWYGKRGKVSFAGPKYIHMMPGQERNLTHEAWHVVWQMQRRVLHFFHSRGYFESGNSCIYGKKYERVFMRLFNTRGN